jgi:cytochrome b involved in lipid metabolism
MCITSQEQSLRKKLPKLTPLTYFSRQTIEKRCAEKEVLVIIFNKVYNLTKWVKHHPGGELAIRHMAGRKRGMVTWF